MLLCVHAMEVGGSVRNEGGGELLLLSHRCRLRLSLRRRVRLVHVRRRRRNLRQLVIIVYTLKYYSNLYILFNIRKIYRLIHIWNNGGLSGL